MQDFLYPKEIAIMVNPVFLILGANGQLGKQFTRELRARNITVHAPDEKDCDITKPEVLAESIEKYAPGIIVNCAAYNAVDDAESKPDIAFLINQKAVENIINVCKSNRIFLVHYSSDYVFDGNKGDLYTEQDQTNPLSVYGKSKRAGELAVLESSIDFLLFRPSWVFGDGTQNFIYKIKQWASKNRILKISADEVSVPTGAADLVNFTLLSLEKGLKGLYHLTNSSYCSRYEWGRYILDLLHLENIVIPVPVSTFKTVAARPLFSPMSNHLLSSKLGAAIPDWKDAVKRFLSE
jgi:dTDP-4-dehydrorhamnose reductase